MIDTQSLEIGDRYGSQAASSSSKSDKMMPGVSNTSALAKVLSSSEMLSIIIQLLFWAMLRKIPFIFLLANHLIVEATSSYSEEGLPDCVSLNSRKGGMIALYIFLTPFLLISHIIRNMPKKLRFVVCGLCNRSKLIKKYERPYVLLKFGLGCFRAAQTVFLFYAITYSLNNGRPYSCYNGWSSVGALLFMYITLLICFVLTIVETGFEYQILLPMKDSKGTLIRLIAEKKRLNILKRPLIPDHEEPLTDYDRHIVSEKIREFRIWIREHPNDYRYVYEQKRKEFENFLADLDMGVYAKQHLKKYIERRLQDSDMVEDSIIKHTMEQILLNWLTAPDATLQKRTVYQAKEIEFRKLLGDEEELYSKIFSNFETEVNTYLKSALAQQKEQTNPISLYGKFSNGVNNSQTLNAPLSTIYSEAKRIQEETDSTDSEYELVELGDINVQLTPKQTTDRTSERYPSPTPKSSKKTPKSQRYED